MSSPWEPVGDCKIQQLETEVVKKEVEDYRQSLLGNILNENSADTEKKKQVAIAKAHAKLVIDLIEYLMSLNNAQSPVTLGQYCCQSFGTDQGTDQICWFYCAGRPRCSERWGN
jgi:hypothetical protein